MSTQRDLFGGAVTVKLPSAYIDASDLRQIPDNQEVFLSANSLVSFIVEILERVEPNDPTEAIKFHFDSIAHDNDVKASEVQSVVPPAQVPTQPQATPAPIFLQGLQRVSKFNREELDEVMILIALYRVQEKNVDVVFSVNIPLAAEGKEVLSQDGVQAAQVAFREAAESFKIVDFGLFA